MVVVKIKLSLKFVVHYFISFLEFSKTGIGDRYNVVLKVFWANGVGGSGVILSMICITRHSLFLKQIEGI